MPPTDRITIHGARQHNLRNLSLALPRHSLTVVTGLSGSGKSSLAFDTLYAEGQRRYVETLSAYARQFLDQMERPEVDSIEGLSPAIAIEQKTTSRSPRSTVGTITEIYDYLRVLWSSLGVPHCPRCGHAITRQSAEQIVQTILREAGDGNARIMILAPVVRGRKGEFLKEFAAFAKAGYARVRVDGEMRRLEELLPQGAGEPAVKLERRKNHTLEVVIDRLEARPAAVSRLQNSVAAALQLANGLVQVARLEGAGGEERLFSEKLACPDCGISLPQLEPRSFSFNSRYGACPACDGLGYRYDFDPGKFITDPEKPAFAGGLGPASGSSALKRQAEAFARSRRIPLDKPWNDLTARQQKELCYGVAGGFPGIIGHLNDMWAEYTSDAARGWLMQYTTPAPCPACAGQRLRPESLAVRLGGRSISAFTALPIGDAAAAMQGLELTPRELAIGSRLVSEVRERLRFLLEVGLGYLSLDRPAASLSGGEAQRIRLAGQIGSQLRGVLYVLDEPSIGLHPRDNGRLLAALERLRDLGNTVIVVEHDRETIERADYVVDLGPGAGRHGGALMAAGTPAMVAAAPDSLTGQYLSGRRSVAVPQQRRPPQPGRALVVRGAREHNLKNIDVTLPAGLLVVLTGVSGAGKSTLVDDILFPALMRAVYGSHRQAGAHDRIEGAELFDKVIDIDQRPIGRTPRSNPATYTGLFTPIRELFALLPESRARGYGAGRFSFNVKGGRCEACEGDGQKRIEMSFLPDVYVPCDVCRGRRYNQETLAVHFKGKSIADILEATVEEALELMENVPKVYTKLRTLNEVGLGYLHLGQAATTLSGGEAQRIKLARELSKRQTGRTLYLLDEPTTGLHFEDVRHLLLVLDRLVSHGNTVLVIEHNLDVIKSADWIVDLGPEGGADGGELVAEGTPEQVARVKRSLTGQELKKVLA